MLRPFRHAAVLLVLAVPALAAQQSGHAADHAAHQQAGKPALDDELQEHFKGISLTEEQVKRVLEIKARHHKAMDALKAGAKDPKDPALKTALEKMMDAEHAEFRGLLTTEQQKRFDENMKERHKAEAKEGAHTMDHGAQRKP